MKVCVVFRYMTLIRKIPFVDTLSPAIQMEVVQKMRPMQFAKSEAITTEGESGLDMYVIISGLVNVMKNGDMVRDSEGAPIVLDRGASIVGHCFHWSARC